MAGDAAAARVGYALNWLNDRGIQGPAVALALVAASCAVADMPHPDLVWSCPEVPGLHARDTRRVYEELVASAEHSLWISTYAYYDGPQAYQDAAQTFLPRRRNKVPSIATTTGSPAGTSSATTSRAAARPSSSGLHRAREKNEWARSCGQARDKPAPGQHAAYRPPARLGHEPARQAAEGAERRGREQRPEDGQQARQRHRKR